MEKIIVLDFGGQYNQLIARRVRDLGVYSEVLSFKTPISALIDPSIKGIILSGGPNSVLDPASPHLDPSFFSIGKPILGICYGAELMAYSLGGTIKKNGDYEFGKTEIRHTGSSSLFNNLPSSFNVFMSHEEQVASLPEGFSTTSSSSFTKNASFEDKERNLYAVQFHPEAHDSEHGNDIFFNFIYSICHCTSSWHPENLVKEYVESLRKEIGDNEVVLAYSGGVDSSVTAALLSKAIGKRLHCIFIDHGLLRKDEAKEVIKTFGEGGNFDLDFKPIDASDIFLSRLKGVTDPEMKRKIIGKSFIDCFKEATKEHLNDYLAQGTIYPDRIESGLGIAASIKSHHNVGGLPKDLGFKGLIEPLKDLFKDEVRKLGLALDLPEKIVNRQPFPGPGLAIRIIGEVDENKIKIVQEADAILREEMAKGGYDKMCAQYYAALSNMRSVGVKGDMRSYDYAVVIRAVNTEDYMSVTPSPLPNDFLFSLATRIVNEVDGVNRVLYDLTSKPPATIELE